MEEKLLDIAMRLGVRIISLSWDNPILLNISDPG